jgi:Ca2+-binding RTX toxin-like protein
MADYTGTAGKDTYTGTPGNDTISGEGGADTLSGGGGADKLTGATDGDQAFALLGTAAFSGADGELCLRLREARGAADGRPRRRQDGGHRHPRQGHDRARGR